MKDSVRNLVLGAVAKTIKGTTFIGIRNYENKQGEVSNQTVLVGFSTENAMMHDFQALQENHDKVFFELSKKMKDDATLVASDGLHPSAKEYAEWEKLILPVAKNILK